MHLFTALDLGQAFYIIRSLLPATPTRTRSLLSDRAAVHLVVKPDNHASTGSFKSYAYLVCIEALHGYVNAPISGHQIPKL